MKTLVDMSNELFNNVFNIVISVAIVFLLVFDNRKRLISFLRNAFFNFKSSISILFEEIPLVYVILSLLIFSILYTPINSRNIIRGFSITLAIALVTFLLTGLAMYFFLILYKQYNQTISYGYFNRFGFITILILVSCFISTTKKNFIIILIFAILFYILNIKNLINMIRLSKRKSLISRDILMNTVLIVILFIFDLSIMFYSSIWISGDMFHQGIKPSYLDILYFTVITFATVGYGDFYPTTLLSKAMSVTTAVTSVVCLVIFINTVLSAKPKTETSAEKDDDKQAHRISAFVVLKRIKRGIPYLSDEILKKRLKRIARNPFLSAYVRVARINKLLKIKSEKCDTFKATINEIGEYLEQRKLLIQYYKSFILPVRNHPE